MSTSAVHSWSVKGWTVLAGSVASRLGQMALVFFCLWNYAWRVVACFGLLVQDRQGHTEVNSMQDHQAGQGTRAQDTWGEAERTTFVLKKKRLDRGVLLQCTIKKASYNIKFLLNVRKKKLPWGQLDIERGTQRIIIILKGVRTQPGQGPVLSTPVQSAWFRRSD